MCPDIAGMIVHFLLHLRHHKGNAFISEETIDTRFLNTGTLGDILQVNITAGSIIVKFQNAADEHIRIATGRILSVVPVFVTVLTVRILFQQLVDLLLLLCCGREMAGGVLGHLHTFTGGDILKISTGRFLSSRFQIRGFQNQSGHFRQSSYSFTMSARFILPLVEASS